MKQPHLNRRHFGASLAALVATPALPALPTARAANMAKYPYTYAAAMCQARGQYSLRFLRETLGYDAKLAQSIHARLVANRAFAPVAAKAIQTVKTTTPKPSTDYGDLLDTAKENIEKVVLNDDTDAPTTDEDVSDE